MKDAKGTKAKEELRLACVYVVKEHLGFYTDPEITRVMESEDLNDVVWRVTTENWGWDRGEAKSMLEENKLRCFYVNPIIMDVLAVVETFLDTEVWLRCRERDDARCKLRIDLCRALQLKAAQSETGSEIIREEKIQNEASLECNTCPSRAVRRDSSDR